MEGISKERLLRKLVYMPIGISDYDRGRNDALNELLIECTELNPWLPIADVPKDRPIIVYYPTMEPGLRIRVIVRSVNWDASLHKPTHYQELPQEPDDPK